VARRAFKYLGGSLVLLGGWLAAIELAFDLDRPWEFQLDAGLVLSGLVALRFGYSDDY
jgi:hypothetical protein